MTRPEIQPLADYPAFIVWRRPGVVLFSIWHAQRFDACQIDPPYQDDPDVVYAGDDWDAALNAASVANAEWIARFSGNHHPLGQSDSMIAVSPRVYPSVEFQPSLFGDAA